MGEAVRGQEEAVSGLGPSGQAASGQAGIGQAGSGQAGSGQAGSGQAGSGQAGSGQAGEGGAQVEAEQGEHGSVDSASDREGLCVCTLFALHLVPDDDGMRPNPIKYILQVQ